MTITKIYNPLPTKFLATSLSATLTSWPSLTWQAWHSWHSVLPPLSSVSGYPWWTSRPADRQFHRRRQAGVFPSYSSSLAGHLKVTEGLWPVDGGQRLVLLALSVQFSWPRFLPRLARRVGRGQDGESSNKNYRKELGIHRDFDKVVLSQNLMGESPKMR